MSKKKTEDLSNIDAVQKFLYMSLGATVLTAGKLKELIDDSGTAAKAEKAGSELIKRARKETAQLESWIREQVDKALESAGYVSREEFNALKKELASQTGSTTSKSTARKAPAKTTNKTTTSKRTKASASSVTAKSLTKKPAAKKAATKKSAPAKASATTSKSATTAKRKAAPKATTKRKSQ